MACSYLGFWRELKRIQAHIEKNRIDVDVALGTTSVDKFAECGNIERVSLFTRAANIDEQLKLSMIPYSAYKIVSRRSILPNRPLPCMEGYPELFIAPNPLTSFPSLIISSDPCRDGCEYATKHLLRLDPLEGSCHTVLSNLYSVAGLYEKCHGSQECDEETWTGEDPKQ
ncbi:hypothetical protein OIU76_004047 [Salix suchowensis]|nr:hypothetical protein OIU76_004047 [Salix suchowensis]